MPGQPLGGLLMLGNLGRKIPILQVLMLPESAIWGALVFWFDQSIVIFTNAEASPDFGIEIIPFIWYNETMEFEYDPDKSMVNLTKHGIDFEAAKALWDDDRSIAVYARDGDDGEARSVVIGQIDGKFWSAVITWRGVQVRIISVRRSRDDERSLYVETNNQR